MSAFGTEANSRNVCCESVFRRKSEVRRALDLGRVGRTGMPITILPYHPLLVSLADSEVRLQATLPARFQGAPPCGRHQRTMWESSLVVLKASQALADRT